tara:strand:- start:15881 stop:16609 length:729 start_codon:yes stop_codon:yes gene_type:complete
MLLFFVVFSFISLEHLSLPIYMALPLAILLGIKLPSLMHNAVHGNLPFGNNLIGELTSQIILVSFGIVSVNHTFHHAFPDSEKDPHSPINKSFFSYFITCLHSGVGVIKKAYLGYHGDSKKSRLIFNLSTVIHFLSLPLKIYLWYKFLGLELFISVYLVAFLIFSFTFAHVNYATHIESEDGEIKTINLNDNLWHKFINTIGDGIYFHHNHHINPKLYNPETLEEKECNPIGDALEKISSFS